MSGRPHHRCGGASSVREGDGNGDGRGGDGDDPLAASAPNWTAGFDLLVGADGPDSFVRNEAMLRWLGAEAAGEAAPRRRGYVVYRGVCGGSESSAAAEAGGGGEERRGEEGWGLESFQTWGPGLRFASVPLAGDERVRSDTITNVFLFVFFLLEVDSKGLMKLFHRLCTTFSKKLCFCCCSANTERGRMLID